MYFKILVPLDGSVLAERALPAACALADRSGADLELLTVVSGGAVDGVSPDQFLVQPYLESVAKPFGSKSRPIRCHVLDGDAPSVIVDFARNQGFSLIAMATHGRTGFVRGLLGSVTDKVILNSPVPVLVVNGGKSLISDAGVDVNHVIVPLDGSELAESAIEHGEALAKLHDAELTFLRVANTSSSVMERSLAQHYLEGISSSLVTEELKVKLRVPIGEPGDSLISAGTGLANALVVMTTRGASGLKRTVRGSVTDQVVRGTSVPTLVVPPVAELTGRCID